MSDRGDDIFWACDSLEQITLPLKDGMFAYDDAFVECESLHHVDLAEGELHETIAAFQLEEWRSEMYEEINSINQILPNADAGHYDEDDILNNYEGEKAQVIRSWIRSVLHKIVHYKAEHDHLLNEAATTLQVALPSDILTNSILPFLVLPPHSFEVEDSEEDEDSDEDVEVDSEEDSEGEGGEEDYLGEERNVSDQEEYDENETAQRVRDKRQRR